VRDEPGIGAFVVTLPLEPPMEGVIRALSRAEIDRLRATRLIVADRAASILIRRPDMPPPVHEAVPG
jgi:hypothetical protein